jgi:hypothetical protein
MATTVGFPKDDLQQGTNNDWKKLVSTERCWRCGGLMVIEHCFDFLDDTGRLDFPAQRCVQCGELVDPVILMNRRRLLGNFRKSKKGSKSSVC